MSESKQRPVVRQVWFAFGTVCVILLTVGGLFFFSLQAIERANRVEQSRALNKLAVVDDIAQDVGEMQADVTREVLASDPNEINLLEQRVHSLEETNAAEFRAFQSLLDHDLERQIYDEVSQARKLYWEQTQLVMEFSRDNRDAEATKLINEKQAPAYDQFLATNNKLIAHLEGDANESAAAMTALISNIRIVGDGLVILGILIVVAAGVAVAKVARQLKEDNRLLEVEVTERKRAEEQLKWKTALLEAQVNATIDGILIVDNNRKMVLQNQRFVDLFRMSSHIAEEAGDEKRLQWVIDLIKDPERFTQKVLYLYAHPSEVSSDEVELVDGRVLDRYSAPVIGNDNEYFGRIWTFRDMTERKREAERLRESEEKFRQIAENISDVFWMTSPDLRTTLYVSPAYERVWGRSAANAYGDSQEWSEAIVPEERESVFATFGRLSTTEPSVSLEFQIARPDGERRWIHSRGVQVRDASGKVIRLTGIATDITDRKNLEAKALQSQKMETVGKLAGGIAHEFNSILTAIIGQCEMLLNDLPAGGALAKSAIEISQAANRAAALTRQLLAYGRKQLLQPESLDLNRIISGMDSVFRLLMGGDVKTQFSPASDLKTVMADAGQIEQVIMNMVINARDAMPNGGLLSLETANISFEEESVGRYPELRSGDYAMLAITDTGTGMNEQVKARLFEPFFTTKAIGQGTGLGLSTCYGIIKQSGGHISVYSEVGRGTTFKIYLPQMDSAAKVAVERKPSPGLPRGTESVLLVEDDPALREMATTLLKRLGYTVWAAANGIEALNLKQQRDVGHIDLLLTDVVMPHMSGKELADRIESLYPHTKVLFTSAYTESAIVHQGALNKGVALLQKPFSPSALARKVRDVLEQPKQA